MAAITIEIPDEIIGSFDSLSEVRRTLYENFIIIQRQQGNISLGRAAELLGVTYTEFFDLLGRKGLSFINASPGETAKSYHHFKRIMEQVAK